VFALCVCRYPLSWNVTDHVLQFALDEREPVALSIHHIPVTITFAFFSEGYVLLRGLCGPWSRFSPRRRDQVLVDPMLKEEQVAEGTMSVTLNVHREVCAIQKAGGAAVSPATISRCCKIAAVKAAEITSLLRDALQQAAHQHQHPPPPPSASSTAATVETQTLGP
jgi:exosome complex component RRP45